MYRKEIDKDKGKSVERSGRKGEVQQQPKVTPGYLTTCDKGNALPPLTANIFT